MSDVSKPYPFIGMAITNGFLTWATGWTDWIAGSGLFHPNFDSTVRQVATGIGIVFCLALWALFSGANIRRRTTVLKYSAGWLIFFFVVTLGIALWIDYIPDQATAVLVRSIWHFSAFFLCISTLTTVTAAYLVTYK